MADQATAEPTPVASPKPRKKGWSTAWSDLALTLPIFVIYHLGVVFLNMRNAADPLTVQLVRLADSHIVVYWGLTGAIGLTFILVSILIGRGQAFEPSRFVLIAIEGTLYAVLMRAAAIYVVGNLPLAVGGLPSGFAAVVMSLGAGFYEELMFRVLLFGGGVLFVRLVFGGIVKFVVVCFWALLTAAIFSAWHYIGPHGDPWDVRTFVFRWVCGLVFTFIYAFRGFAPAVWTHALYDIWVMTSMNQ